MTTFGSGRSSLRFGQRQPEAVVRRRFINCSRWFPPLQPISSPYCLRRQCLSSCTETCTDSRCIPGMRSWRCVENA